MIIRKYKCQFLSCLLQLSKIDLETKTYSEWGEDKCYPSEPVFVPNPNGTTEDDGIHVCFAV